ncbi:MAG TPA: hypothetical protein PLX89_07190 [Verrucomicrobiota bacterium]|nr:hypothetical protein [Verrucomicrobiota bacterium]
MSNSRASFFRQSAWLAFATVLGGAFMTAVHSVVPLLGTSQYEVFGAMLRLFLLLGIPSAGLQTAFAQQTASALTLTDRQRLAATSRRVLGGIVGIWLVMLAVTYWGQEAISVKLKLGDGLVLWPTLGVGLLWLVLPVLRGLLQGAQDFATLGWVSILDGFLRLSLIIVVVLVAGATWSNYSFHNLSAFAQRLKSPTNPISAYLRGQMSEPTRSGLADWSGTGKVPEGLQELLVRDLNSFLLGSSLWDSGHFSEVPLRPATQELLRRKPLGKDLARLNRLLLEDAFPLELPRNRFVSREAAAAIGVAFLAMLASTGIALAKTRHIWGGPGAEFAWRPWLARVLPFTLGAGALLLLANVDLIYLKTIIPEDRAEEFLLGQRYQPASMIGFALVQFTVPLAMVMFSKIAHSVAAGGQTDALVLALVGTLLLGSAAAGFVTLFPKLPLQILYFRTPANVAAAPIVPWCAWAMLAFALANVLVSNLLARSRFEIVPWAVGLVFVFLLTLIWLKPHFLGLEPFLAFRRFVQILGGFNLLLLALAAWITWGRRVARA